MMSNFKGATPEMSGHVFQCSNETNDKNQFVKTLEALSGYIAKHVTNPGDMLPLTKELTKPTVAMPTKPKATGATKTEEGMFLIQLKSYSFRKDTIDSNLKALFTVIWGQCSDAMQLKIKSNADYETKDGESDCVWLLNEIRGVIMKFEGQRYLNLSLREALYNFTHYKQYPGVSLAMYLEEFRMIVDTYKHYGGQIRAELGLLKVEDQTLTEAKRLQISHDKVLGLAFLDGADKRLYGALCSDLKNQFSRGNNQYLKDLTAAHALLASFKPVRDYDQKRRTADLIAAEAAAAAATAADLAGLSFAQTSTIMPGTNGTAYPHITCFTCNNKGHYSSECPKQESTPEVKKGVQLLQLEEDTTN